MEGHADSDLALTLTGIDPTTSAHNSCADVEHFLCSSKLLNLCGSSMLRPVHLCYGESSTLTLSDHRHAWVSQMVVSLDSTTHKSDLMTWDEPAQSVKRTEDEEPRCTGHLFIRRVIWLKKYQECPNVALSVFHRPLQNVFEASQMMPTVTVCNSSSLVSPSLLLHFLFLCTWERYASTLPLSNSSVHDPLVY